MTSMADERTYMRIQTAAFIAADAKEITLIPQTETPNGSGGFNRTEGAPREPQTLRLIPQQGSMSPARTTLDGEVVQPDYILLGVYDADIRRWDLFTDQGRRYLVVFVHENVNYETKGEVLYLGDE